LLARGRRNMTATRSRTPLSSLVIRGNSRIRNPLVGCHRWPGRRFTPGRTCAAVTPGRGLADTLSRNLAIKRAVGPATWSRRGQRRRAAPTVHGGSRPPVPIRDFGHRTIRPRKSGGGRRPRRLPSRYIISKLFPVSEFLFSNIPALSRILPTAPEYPITSRARPRSVAGSPWAEVTATGQ
jgi:hypothetical protein